VLGAIDATEQQDEDCWSRVMMDLLFGQVSDIGEAQKQLQEQFLQITEQYAKDHAHLRKQVEETGHAIAQLILEQLRRQEDEVNDTSNLSSPSSAPSSFQNHRAFGHQPNPRRPPGGPHPEQQPERSAVIPHHTLPKMSFPRFDGVDPTIWKEKCLDHFKLRH
jgi:hypothetical protein